MSVGGMLRAAGAFLLILPFLPLRALFGDPPGTNWLVGPYEWLLGAFVFLAAAWLVSRLVPDLVERGARGVARLLHAPGDRAFRLVSLALLALLLFVASTFAFSRAPLLIDAIIQVFQAKIFAAGRIFAPAPEHHAFFATQHMVVEGGRWYSQYPPGHAGALTLGVWMGATWLVPIALSVGSAWLVTDATRRLFGEAVARTTLVLLVLAPFYWFMGASHMNHVSALFLVALFLWCYVRWAGVRAPREAPSRAPVGGPTAGDGAVGDEADGEGASGDGAGPEGGRLRPIWMGFAGLALGAAFLSRPLTALAVGLAFAVPTFRIAGRRAWPAVLWGSLGFSALAALYLAYNAATTGHAFTPGYLRLWGEGHGLGFHLSPWGDAHTPLTGLRNELVDLAMLNNFLFEWGVPALWPLGLALAAGWLGGRWAGRLAGAFFAIPAAYFFYWHRDAFLGPRYMYEGLVFLIPLTALSLHALRRRLRGRAWRALGGADAGTLVAALIGLSFLYAIAYGTPQRFGVYQSGLQSVKRDLVAEARAAGISEGLVFIAVSWGNRLIARARGAGAGASVVERVYRTSDHCDLEMLLEAAERDGWPPDRLDAELLAIVRPPGEVEVTPLNEDITMRLVPGRPLAPLCAQEVRYDRPGYGNFSPYLVHNRPDLSGPLVFARDLRERNGILRAAYPELPAYLNRRGTFVPLP